ncbi:Cys-tRNA(Pro) deacylase [Isoalcanivorax beigongshangi]|uniref:Cys-tRNA(Pro)/Cys-tRNA(Cys) deacylase n=1 Tax=Isoalcanivorax beigongshangi TaxID=3238810 RepID=A0ABV4AIP7_9GAMM
MTPAIDALRKAKIAYQMHSYSHEPGADSYGQEAADKLGLDRAEVFKTLVVETERGQLAVAVVPVSGQLDLKRMAQALEVKKVAMAPPPKVERSTGYVLGGVSPLGQKKRLPTVIDSSAEALEQLYVSGGKRGLDLSLAPADLAALTGAKFAPIGRAGD